MPGTGEADIIQVYNKVASAYADIFCSAELADAECRYVSDLVSMGPTGKQTLLDIGCGPAVYFPLATRAGLNYIGVDLAIEMLMIGRLRFHGVRLTKADAISLPIAARSVAFAVAMGSLSHMRRTDFTRAIGEIARVIRVGGAFLLGDQIGNRSSLVPYPLAPETRVRVYPRSVDVYRRVLMGHGFVIVRIEVRAAGVGEMGFDKTLIWATLGGGRGV